MPNLESTKDVTQPSIFVDAKVLIPSTSSNLNFCNDSKDEVASELERSKAEFVQFEVYEVGKKMEEVDVYCSTPDGSESGDDNMAMLKMTLQPVSNGYIINNSCYLTWQQWHTLVSPNITDRLLYCIVCAAYIEIASGEDHVGTANHRAALESFPPLEKLDLSITRKIRNQYHCGVCNEVFHVKDENNHFSGKMHEGNLLFSINRASDLLDNYGYPKSIENKTETYHFKTHKMRNDSASGCESISSDFGKDNLSYINWQNNYHEENQYEDDDVFEQPAFTGLSYATMAKKPKAKTETFLDIDLGNKKVKVRFDSWHMVISPVPNRFWCMVCKLMDSIRNKQAHCLQPAHLHNLNACGLVPQYTHYFIRQVDDKLYHCGHCNNLQLIHEMDDHIETNHPKKGQTKTVEAKIISSPIKNNENNQNGLNTTKINNNNNSPTKNNDGPLKNDNATTKNNNTPTKNNNDPAKNNNAPMNNNDTPTKNNSASTKSNNVPTINNNSPIMFNVKKDEYNFNNSVKPLLSPKKEEEKDSLNNNAPLMLNNMSYKMPNIFEDMVIFPFGYKITIPSLAYNIVCKRPTDFYCGLCDLLCEENAISGHVYEMKHLELLHRTPFIAPYSCNLIRAIRDMLHCAICNIPIAAIEIYNHIQNPQHIDLLYKALGQNTQTPINVGVKPPTVPEIPKLGTNLQSITNIGAMIPKTVSNTNNVVVTNTTNVVTNTSNATNLQVGSYGAMIPKPVLNTTNVGTTNLTNAQLGAIFSKPVSNTTNKGTATNNLTNVQLGALLSKPVLNTSNVGTNTTNATNVKVEAVVPKPVLNTKNFNVGTNTTNAKNVEVEAMFLKPALNTTNFNVGAQTTNATNIPVGMFSKPVLNTSNVVVKNTSDPTIFEVVPVTNVPNAINDAKNVVNNQNFGATTNIDTEVKRNLEVKHTEMITEEEEVVEVEEEMIEDYDEEDFDGCDENDNTFDSVASEDATFDVEEYVYLKLKNTYIKISNTSYNTLVCVGDGSRYCFVCAEKIQSYELQKHVDSRSHLENMEKYRFLDKYEDHLLRQIYLMYHCAICNVIISRKELKLHLEWPTHALQNENTLKNIKKTRKNDIKGGIKQIIVFTQKENIYLHEKEPNVKIIFNAKVIQSLDSEENKNEEFCRKNKIVIFNDNVLKLPWEHWQGISKIKNGYKCNLCQRDLKSADIDVHCTSEWHKYSLDKPFEKQYAPALVRKINELTLNCVICNTEVSNKPALVAEHINGKRHARAHDAILKDSSQARTYTDCHNDVLML